MIQKGYKKTKIGIIPDNWEVVKLREVFEKSFYGISSATKNIGKYPVLKMNNMQNGSLSIDNLSYIDLEDTDFKKYKLQKGDILLNRTNSSELVGKISLFNLDGDYLTASYIVTYRPNKNILNSIFINNILNTTLFQTKIKNISTKGVSQSNINPTSFKKKIIIPLPPLKEQEKIAKILTLWDSAILKQSNLIDEKENFKKALMQRLLSGKTHFPEFKDNWKEVRLGEIFKEYAEFNNLNLKQYTIGKNGINEIKDYKYNTKKHKIFKKNDLIIGLGVNEVNTNIFIENGCCSPIYRTYSININLIKPIFSYYYLPRALNFIKHLISKKSTRREFEFDGKEFIKQNIKLPSLKEQEKIAKILTLCDDEINLLKQELENLKEQKQGLMQKLLSGKVRV
ncbi:type I restriction/modification system, specificity subunit [Campylobacter blaseri]|uniref:Type I restriction modification DNA specificity domain-containing protein n=1 Tax=Campylobacter blaseri TaxID=2042961 RepID=A0A2P8QYI1_9BACT|nr:restriction endonuclease subunit S [Campylobacter blaseri]PSM51318.1 hypothetical protein CQ405_08805 [Campylobacter blaseri]PSM52462.1 hypothetical protein CRN67_08810 [Campylobacter blaseri]QKF86206.1 type I restriction/modification system, specificity subunit [Campylobacter blaseri]